MQSCDKSEMTKESTQSTADEEQVLMEQGSLIENIARSEEGKVKEEEATFCAGEGIRDNCGGLMDCPQAISCRTNPILQSF